MVETGYLHTDTALNSYEGCQDTRATLQIQRAYAAWRLSDGRSFRGGGFFRGISTPPGNSHRMKNIMIDYVGSEETVNHAAHDPVGGGCGDHIG